MVELDKAKIELKLFSSELSLEDSKVFKELMALYPWCSSFTVAYLKSLKTKNDLRFSSELEKYAVELNSRSVIYDLTKNFDEKIIEESSVVHQTIEKPKTDLSEEDELDVKQDRKLKETKTDALDKLIESEALAARVLKDLKDELPDQGNKGTPANSESENIEIEKPQASQEEAHIDTPRSFNGWLTAGSVQSDAGQKKEYLTFEKPKVPFFSPIKKAKESLGLENLPVSETLAKVFESQGNYAMAKTIYEQLILIFPEKKSFFADQIQKLINKTK
ncbi:MAG: hypothetical protein CBB76_10550 [Crocinitomicaceae bacterium TMED16]|nr:MAG: hypothetical protein CBB76_10550 [Crocinitomicaceae bacterium TMED16]